MGKSNNRKDMHDFADDYEDYGDYRMDAESDYTGSDVAPAEPGPADAQFRRASGNAAPASTAIKAKMSSRPMKLVGMGPGQRSQPAKQNAKRGNQTGR
jgi:hypothetical protein